MRLIGPTLEATALSPRVRDLLGIAKRYGPWKLDERQVDLLREWLKLPALERDAAPELPGTEDLFPHQRQALAFLESREGRAMLAMEMRCGKTRTAIEWLVSTGELSRTLVLAPLSVVYVWRHELERWAGVAPSLVVGTGQEKLDALSQPGPWVTNYETMRQLEPLKRVVALKPKALVLDESTRIKDRTTITTRAIHGVASKVPGSILTLSGKPTPEGPLDVWSQVKTFEKTPLGFATWYAMRNEYAILGGYLGKQIVGYRNEADFTERFREVAFRVRRADVFDTLLPERQRIEVELSSPEKRAYKAMQEDCLVQLKDRELTAANVLAQLIRLQQITSGVASPKGGAKLTALADLLDDLPRPVVVWARFIEDLDRIEALAKRRKEKSGRIDGGVTGKARDQVLRAFTDGRLSILAANPAAAGMGLDLSRTEAQVYYSVAWSHEQRAQSEARSEGPRRTGPPAPIFDLEAVIGGKKTIDSMILDALDLKSNLAALVMGDLSAAFGTQSVRPVIGTDTGDRESR